MNHRPAVDNEPRIPESYEPAGDSRVVRRELKRWQFSLKALFGAVTVSAVAAYAMARIWRAENYASPGVAIEILVVFILAGAVADALIGQPKKWLAYGALAGLLVDAFLLPIILVPVIGAGLLLMRPSRQSNTDNSPAQTIARRQALIYRRACTYTVLLLILWFPIAYMVPAGGGCRPMFQLPLTVLVILPASAVGIVRAVIQVVATWPKKRLAITAIIVSLIPLATFVLIQWIILSVLGIIYEE